MSDCLKKHLVLPVRYLFQTGPRRIILKMMLKASRNKQKKRRRDGTYSYPPSQPDPNNNTNSPNDNELYGQYTTYYNSMLRKRGHGPPPAWLVPNADEQQQQQQQQQQQHQYADDDDDKDALFVVPLDMSESFVSQLSEGHVYDSNADADELMDEEEDDLFINSFEDDNDNDETPFDEPGIAKNEACSDDRSSHDVTPPANTTTCSQRQESVVLVPPGHDLE